MAVAVNDNCGVTLRTVTVVEREAESVTPGDCDIEPEPLRVGVGPELEIVIVGIIEGDTVSERCIETE